jgi:hypothetical protein
MATTVRLYKLKCPASSCDRGDGAHYKTPKLESGPAVKLMKKHMAAHHPPATLPTSPSCTPLTDSMKLLVIQSIAAKDFYGLPIQSLPVGIKVKVGRKKVLQGGRKSTCPPRRQLSRPPRRQLSTPPMRQLSSPPRRHLSSKRPCAAARSWPAMSPSATAASLTQLEGSTGTNSGQSGSMTSLLHLLNLSHCWQQTQLLHPAPPLLRGPVHALGPHLLEQQHPQHGPSPVPSQ